MLFSTTMGRRNSNRRVERILAVVVLGSASMATVSCGRNRISGTYVAHGPSFAAMLQLTQAENAYFTGVLSSVELKADGNLESAEASITGGAFDAGQLTLSFGSSLFGKNLAGTVKASTIEIHTVGSNGDVQWLVFERSSPEQFKRYLGDLKGTADAMVLNANLAKRAEEFRQTVQEAEAWLADADMHAQKVPGVKDYYRKLEDDMRSLVARERSTSNSVARAQISVRVNQRDVLGTQADLEVDQMWDHTIPDAGLSLSKKLSEYTSSCGVVGELKKHRASPEAVNMMTSSCQTALAERAKFDPILKRILEQRADLKSFESQARGHRQAITNEAIRLR